MVEAPPPQRSRLKFRGFFSDVNEGKRERRTFCHSLGAIIKNVGTQYGGSRKKDAIHYNDVELINTTVSQWRKEKCENTIRSLQRCASNHRGQYSQEEL